MVLPSTLALIVYTPAAIKAVGMLSVLLPVVIAEVVLYTTRLIMSVTNTVTSVACSKVTLNVVCSTAGLG